ncbi:2-succinyl-5-enolpyruvyl-6-hydroxy-3-cyclohexene- 1-carboxylate synthase [Fulvitalea axinellae]|uniref:2-succinyl-5-enolpyruvyl-6-hydroxy-3-cyclohexene-1-carboxylate synthase n=1 Tax=Fulvitalea axinellae TaxID=1182444 RepID=A0AAU9D817_9BACT|nr:2-succinyl-5-enolpyruvyl-6-hydroxy-3-cyclohexene- 1-carboxylate synthase [Fulvitalea axinellae]
MILQPIIDIASVCAGKGVDDFVLSPGSRCAHLTIAMVRHPDINTRTVSDERAAGFMALGLAQRKGRAMGLVCTSGSAAYNYSPAVSEAFYQRIPLLVLTADRPPEWIGQQDGQTISQPGLFGKHVKASFDLPSDYSHPDAEWHVNRTINEAINLANSYPQGPVHVNVPIREPFYPEADEKISFSKPRIVEEQAGVPRLTVEQTADLASEIEKFGKVLVVAGQERRSEAGLKAVSAFSHCWGVPVLADVISNMHAVPNTVRLHDAFLIKQDLELKETLRPDLIITFGKSVISKQAKLFLRKNKPVEHWHIQESGDVADTFQSLTRVIRANPYELLWELSRRVKTPMTENYLNAWLQEDKLTAELGKTYFDNAPDFSDFSALDKVWKAFPEEIDLHLSNSMSVRWGNYLGVTSAETEVFANRGTSGIDGCTGTAVGSAWGTERLNVLVTGDLAFFYDRNAFWHNYPPRNLKVILINNHAGGIFGMIDGPARQDECAEYFETYQAQSAENTAKDFNLEYRFADSYESLDKALGGFFQIGNKPGILEIRTEKALNRKVFDGYKNMIKTTGTAQKA